MSNRLLLAEGDPKSLRVLDVSLRSAGFTVETATTGAEAWASLERALPDVVIAASDLAALDGFDLCGRLRRRADGTRLPFILMGADPSVENKIKGLQAGADEYLVKPVLVNDIVARVVALVRRRDRDKLASNASTDTSFSGKLSDLTPVDLVEVVAAGNRSGIVHLRDLRGSPGTIYFRRGAIVDAEVGRLSGPDAIGRLFSWSQGTFEVEWKNIRRPDVIQRPATELVLDGMRRLDDWNHLASQVPDLHEVYEVNYRVLAERLAEIPDEVNGVLRLFDGARSLAHVVEDSTLADLDALGMVLRLRDEGIIRPVAHRKPARGRGADAARAEAAPEEVSSRLSTASRAVEQSFANRTASDASGPHRVPSEAAPPSETAISPPPMTRTAPGLGQPVADGGAEATADADAVPQPRDSEANVIHVPAEPSAATVVVEPDAAVATASPPLEIPGPSSLDASSPQPADAPIPEQVPPLHHTQRGMGPMGMSKPKGDGVASDTPRPVSLPGVAPMPASEQSPSRSVTPPATLVLPAAGDQKLGGAGAQAAPAPASPASAAKAADADGVVPSNQAVRADETVRVAFRDDDLSQREALDELGLPGGRRIVRVVAVVLAIGALSAVAVHRLRTKISPSTEVAQNAPPPTPSGPGSERPPAAQNAKESPSTPEKPSPSEGTAAGRLPGTVPSDSDHAAVAAQPPLAGTAKEAEPTNGSTADHGETAAPPGKTKVEPHADTVAGKAAPAGAPSERAKPATSPPAAERAAGAESPAKSAQAEKPTAALAAPATPVDFAHQLQDCRSQFLKNKLRDASASCAAALQTNPRSPDALTLMAHVELNRGRPNRANELAQKAVALDPRQADAYVIIGGVHQDNGRIPQAKAAYNQYLELAPHGRYADELRSIIGNL